MAKAEKVTKKLCFVVGPIGEDDSEQRIHADWLLDGIILPTFERHFSEFAVERADKIPTPGMVSSQIINRLHEADLVIADLSFHNANAFYEMAIRHNVGKPIIHMIRKGERIPFDVIPHRAIPFSNVTPGDHYKARDLLLPAIQAAIEPGFEADNPIKHARGRLEVDKSADPALKVLSDEVSSLRSRLDAYELKPHDYAPNAAQTSRRHAQGVIATAKARAGVKYAVKLLIDWQKNVGAAQEILAVAVKFGRIESWLESAGALEFVLVANKFVVHELEIELGSIGGVTGVTISVEL
jgi:hypothetical protein